MYRINSRKMDLWAISPTTENSGRGCARARKQMCFRNAYRISRTEYRYHIVGNHNVIRPRTFPAIDASLAACLPAPVSSVRVSLRSRSPALHAVGNSIFPIFPRKKGPMLQSRNMIAPLFIKQNEETAGEIKLSFSLFHDKRKDYAAFYFSISHLCLFSFFSCEQSLLSRGTEMFYDVELKL